jgi:hypothetical protein
LQSSSIFPVTAIFEATAIFLVTPIFLGPAIFPEPGIFAVTPNFLDPAFWAGKANGTSKVDVTGKAQDLAAGFRTGEINGPPLRWL